MPLTNSFMRYGGVTKMFHWLTALLILTAIPLGVIANGLPYETQDQFQQKAMLFSLHKTVGVLAFLIGLARIVWATVQVKPGLLNADKPVESFLAELVHWLLYGSLVIVPLSGWLHHAATTGFAPLLLPFGDTLPGIPKDPDLAHIFGQIHYVVTKVLFASVALHVAGALKHHFIDRDDTLRRMWPGAGDTVGTPRRRDGWTPLAAAVVVHMVALSMGMVLGLRSDASSPAIDLTETVSGWKVQDGTVSISVQQLGSTVTGAFGEWTAAIEFSEAPTEGRHGSLEAVIAVSSLTLGSITNQALSADFLDASTHPVAVFSADLLPRDADGAYLADGALSLKGVEVPVQLPFTLRIEGDTATASGAAVLRRLDFGIGSAYPDASTLGLDVAVEVALTATRATN
ncbi:MAG: cytochrome b/b6 domain-containing protein [Pseudomonadota bacterium]